MSKRRDTPALFELVRSSGIKKPGSGTRPTPSKSQANEPPRPPSRAESEEAFAQAASAVSTSTATVDEPVGLGRTIRVPLGYVVLAVSATVVLVVIAYSVGFARGKIAADDARSRADRWQFDDTQAGGGSDDPLSQEQGSEPGGSGRTSTATNGGSMSGLEASGQPPVREGSARQPAGGRLARDVDTRQVGLNYIIVEQFGPDEADAVADFLEPQGIDVMVLQTNNRNLRQVIVRQGFEGWRTNTQAQEMLDRIKRLGRQWKRDYGGTKDFEEAFGSRHDG